MVSESDASAVGAGKPHIGLLSVCFGAVANKEDALELVNKDILE